jgi:hypothetical protein
MFFKKNKNMVALSEAKGILMNLELDFSKVDNDTLKVETVYRNKGKDFNSVYLKKEKKGISISDGWGETMSIAMDENELINELKKFSFVR